MFARRLFGQFVALLFLAIVLHSCDSEQKYEFAPYKGRKWFACHNGDTLLLELSTATDVVMYSVTDDAVVARGRYYTRRMEFPFTGFEAQMDGVMYNFYYATYDARLNLTLYGDSLNVACDTAWAAWQKAFVPLGNIEDRK